MGIVTRFFGRTIGDAAGEGMGIAVANVLQPAVQELANAAWEGNTHLPLDPADAAAAHARSSLPGYPGLDLGGVLPEKEAAYKGIRGERFKVLTALNRRFASVDQLLTLRRRRLALGGDNGISQDAFRTGMRHEGFTTEDIDELTKLLTVYLDPADVANAVQQGFVPEEGLLPPPETGGPPFTPPTEQQNIDAEGEAGTAGLDRARLRVLAELSGNPPGPEQLLELWRRGIITETAVDRGIREGRTKTKWTPPLKALRWQLLNPATLVNLFLRGWIDRDTYHKRMRVHGYADGEADDWYDASGRPAAPGQMMTAWARGVDGPDGVPMDKAQFLKGIVESDIRPEWGEMLWGLRHNYPSLFQLRNAVQAGALSPARAATILGYERYEPQDAAALVAAWLRGSGTTSKGLTATDLAAEYEGRFITRTQYIAGLKQLGYGDPEAANKADAEDAKRARTARNQLIGRARLQYVNHRVTRDRALATLDAAGVPARVRDLMMPDWDLERDLTADALTAAQIRKAFRQGTFDRTTAVDRLEAKGYDADDAGIYLDE